MADPITSSVVSAAGSAAGRVMGPMLLGGARSRLERRAIKKRASHAEFHGADEVDAALVDISAADREKILSFTQSAEFENMCFEVAIAGCMPGDPDNHLTVLKETFEISLRRYAGMEDANIRLVAGALFAEIVAISWREVKRHQAESGIGKRAFTPEIISSYVASASRNAELHRRLTNLAAVDHFSGQLSRQCTKIHGRIRPAQTESGARVPFESLYVEPKLTTGDKRHGREDSFNVRELLKQVTRLVVLGDPGGGKTTLALKLALDVARGLGTVPALQTPLRVVLRDYAGHYKAKQESIIEFLEKQSKADYSTPAPEGAIEYLLLNGRAVVIFDGLDELTDTSLRTAVVDMVEAFSHAYPTTPILVTSRRVGYEMAPLDETLFTVSHLSPFDSNQQEEYVNKWFSHVRRSSGEGDMTGRFLVEASHASDLTSNPLMLGLMCALYRGEGYIPRNRPDLYRRCSEFLFERWDASRGITTPKPFERGIQFAMFSLALSMLRNLDGGGGMTERELIRYTSDYLLGQQYEDRDISDAAAEAFVKYCRGRAWVLTDVGTNPCGERIYSFTHRTFLEYFSARQLVRDSGDSVSLYRELRSHLVNESWDVTAQLAVQFLDERLGDAANDFVILALQDANDVSDFKQKAALISFCARLLEFMVLRPTVVRQVVRALQQMSGELEVGAKNPRRNLVSISSGWSGVSMCAPESRSVIVDELLGRDRRDRFEFDELQFAITMAQSVPRHASVETRKFWKEQDKENAREVLLDDLTQANPRAAALAVLYGLLDAVRGVEMHGPSVMTAYSVFPRLAQRTSAHNVISELAYPRLVTPEEADRIAGEVLNVLLSAPTPWMAEPQKFLIYYTSLSEWPNLAACAVLSWMLGVEMDADEPMGPEGGSEEESEFDGIGAHKFLICLARVRQRKVPESSLEDYRTLVGSEFFDFASKWARGELSMSHPDSD
ncbi:NACHT domain-containing protein [Streptomyces sp. NPDC127108]|uniref:NACHT domain-containing protein n=1 Tax=Streptomyces sp. NPDC127108 TaxID=3345361 RepID=UPI0036320992